jgi:hypothetical protein
MAGKTGPTSTKGKAKVAGNALKHGLRSNRWMFPDEQLDFAALVADLEAEYNPSTATQRILVERIALCTTKLRRLHPIEDVRFHKARVDDVSNLMTHYPNSSTLKIKQTEAGALPSLPFLDTMARYQTTLDRQVSKAIGELMVLKANASVLLETPPDGAPL